VELKGGSIALTKIELSSNYKSEEETSTSSILSLYTFLSSIPLPISSLPTLNQFTILLLQYKSIWLNQFGTVGPIATRADSCFISAGSSSRTIRRRDNSNFLT